MILWLVVVNGEKERYSVLIQGNSKAASCAWRVITENKASNIVM
jgi:hypothetical protein